jgi:hypothetical protein
MVLRHERQLCVHRTLISPSISLRSGKRNTVAVILQRVRILAHAAVVARGSFSFDPNAVVIQQLVVLSSDRFGPGEKAMEAQPPATGFHM